jgi:hypothetical protein
VVRQQDVAQTGRADGTYVVKFHGDAATPDERVVLSRDDYDAFFDQRRAMAALLEGLLLNQTFLFVGYSLRDPNFRQVYNRIAGILRGAKRTAYAVSFDAVGPTGDHLAKQWERKGLHLIRIPGASAEEQTRAYLRMLDHLAESVTRRLPHLFQTEEPAEAPVLAALQQFLREKLGDEIEALCQRPLTPAEATHVAQVLDFLTRVGWRPQPHAPMPLPQLWETLAERVGEAGARRGMLITALRHTERFSTARRLRQKLAESAKDPR